MTARILPLPSRGLGAKGRSRSIKRATPQRHGIEIVRLDRAVGQEEDPLLGRGVGIADALLVPPDSAHRDAKLFGELQLVPAFVFPPVRQFHAHTCYKKVLPKWLHASLAVWQYANMANGQIVYIRAVANDDDPPNRIQELIDDAGINQAELARRANVSVSALNKVIKGTRGLDQEWMRKLAPHLGVTPAELLPREDNPMILSSEERGIIDRLRRADDATRAQLERVAEAILPFAHQTASAA